MKSITEVTDVRGTYVLVRSSCNVPLVDGKVGNTFRLKRALTTIDYLREAGARVIVLAHIGRAKTDTLYPVYEAFRELIPMTWGGVVASTDFMAKRATMIDGDILLAENLRQDVREEENDFGFATELASLGDIYVDDAFDNIHRNHASMVTLPTLLPAYAGMTLREEVAELQKAMHPVSPSLFVLGGAKFETKIPLVEKYLALYDRVFVTGALLNDMLKAWGYEVGTSLVSNVSLAGAAFLSNPKLVLAVDVVVQSERGTRVALVSDVQPDEKITDMGPETMESIAPLVASAATVLWNGPLGLYEAGAAGGTHQLAEQIAASQAFSIIGGGDTVAAIESLGLNDKFGFVSTGGGAMLTVLELGTTPALDALE